MAKKKEKAVDSEWFDPKRSVTSEDFFLVIVMPTIKAEDRRMFYFYRGVNFSYFLAGFMTLAILVRITIGVQIHPYEMTLPFAIIGSMLIVRKFAAVGIGASKSDLLNRKLHAWASARYDAEIPFTERLDLAFVEYDRAGCEEHFIPWTPDGHEESRMVTDENGRVYSGIKQGNGWVLGTVDANFEPRQAPLRVVMH